MVWIFKLVSKFQWHQASMFCFSSKHGRSDAWHRLWEKLSFRRAKATTGHVRRTMRPQGGPIPSYAVGTLGCRVHEVMSFASVGREPPRPLKNSHKKGDSGGGHYTKATVTRPSHQSFTSVASPEVWVHWLVLWAAINGRWNGRASCKTRTTFLGWNNHWIKVPSVIVFLILDSWHPWESQWLLDGDACLMDMRWKQETKLCCG